MTKQCRLKQNKALALKDGTQLFFKIIIVIIIVIIISGSI